MVINATRDPSGLPQNYGPVHPTNTGPSSLPVHQRAHTSSHPISPPIPPQFSAPAPTFQQAPPNGIPDWLDPIYVSGVFPPTPVRPALQVPLGAGAPLDRHMQAVPNYDAASYLCGIDGCESVLDPETSQSHIRDLHYPPHMNAETVARKQRLQCRYTGCSADVADFYALHRHLQTKHWESSATCPVCELTFDCTDTLVKHLKKYHPGE
ncbi:hypothetical protein C2E23DRAFT_589832 [Lenzites betulinus]|nr:hypothetical protein C2E23DRAFT_589832 [Lenzites betulinus]